MRDKRRNRKPREAVRIRRTAPGEPRTQCSKCGRVGYGFAGTTGCCGRLVIASDAYKLPHPAVRVVVTCHDAPLTMSAAKVLERRLDRLIARGVVDLEPYILHHLGRGPDPDRKRRPRPYVNPWNTVE